MLGAGSRLGPYEIVASIGAGAMGHVYRARDTRLDHHVVIKVFPAEFAQNAQLNGSVAAGVSLARPAGTGPTLPRESRGSDVQQELIG